MRHESRLWFAGVVAVVMMNWGCAAPNEENAIQTDFQEQAQILARETIIVDTHIDLPYRLQSKYTDISVLSSEGHIDGPRARQGGLDAPFMSIYVPASLHGTDEAPKLADDLIDMVEEFEAKWPEWFVVARSPAEVEAAFGKGLISLPMGMENGSPIGDDLDLLQHFYDRGIRYITLSHGENNQICDSSYAEDTKWGGLSPFGRDVVAEMNRLGIMVDISHVTDETFWQVLEISEVPVIASHSSCRSFTPGWQRNMGDEMIAALGENGGVIQINFGSAFIDEEAQKQSEYLWTTVGSFVEEHGLDWASEEAEAFSAQLREEHPPVSLTVADVADHIDHVVELAGVHHVGFGSDFDGVIDLPEGLEDASGYPNLIAELLRRGYSEDDVRKICGGNVLRVWQQVEDHAASLGE
ncbi:MAG: membrane dipeptidase [bacterium]|nr:membrane dipeptidase [bacterium]